MGFPPRKSLASALRGGSAKLPQQPRELRAMQLHRERLLLARILLLELRLRRVVARALTPARTRCTPHSAWWVGPLLIRCLQTEEMGNQRPVNAKYDRTTPLPRR